MLIDLHTHTKFSFDGESTAEEMIETAIKSGIKILALTDHLDINEYWSDYYKVHELIPLADKKIPLLKQKYEGRIEILHGIEFGQAVHNIKKTESILKDKPYDMILGSVHSVREEKDFYYIDYKTADCESLFQRYFEEVLETIEWGGIDTISHLTYPLRYLVGREKLNYDFDFHINAIEKILKKLVEKNIGLEINSGGLRAENYFSTDPPFKYIKRYRELGGEIITIGSDAHRACDLGKGINEAVEIAKNAGFKKITYFKKRTPHFIEITSDNLLIPLS